MRERWREKVADMTPEQIRRVADELARDVAGRGLFVRFAASGIIKELRSMATAKAQGASQ